jgi:asparagine synthase (glutamine-hydrolysing)
MCGIIGAVGSFDNKVINSAVGNIKHRGPDSAGIYVKENVFLGHTRLSILDLSENGNQPMFSDDKRYVIIFNGEIYNHLEIRRELLTNRDFRSSGDTETVLYAYIQYGTSIFAKLNGIFAFSIFDNETSEIVIIRDHFGVKPLYFYKKDDLFLFGSELKSFLPFKIDLSYCPEAVFNYISFLWSPGEKTAFKYVKKLLPGTFLKFNIKDNIDIDPVSFYKLNYPSVKSNLTEEQLIDELENHLLNAVERQLLSDVPVGFFLSGGLDSSLLVAMARRLNPQSEMKCFTIDVGENNASIEGFTDDLYYSKKVASYLNVELNIVNANFDIVEMFDKMIWHLDEPQADAAPLNVLKIASLARDQNIKVLIGGSAGDDLFSGYRRHQALNIEKYIKVLPSFIISLVQGAVKLLPLHLPAVRRLKKLVSNLHQTPIKRQLNYFSWLPESTVHSLFAADWKKIIKNYDPFDYFYKVGKDLDKQVSDLDRMLFWELKTFLVDHNLNYTDKLGMAVGVEARVPFLDLDLVEFSQSIPTSMKMRGKETKYILKKVAERYLPHDVIYRPKTGFGAPVRKWITSDLQPMIDERLSIDRIKARGIFNPDAVWDLINQNKSGKIDASYSIWALLAIESWCMQFVDGIELYKVKNKAK